MGGDFYRLWLGLKGRLGDLGQRGEFGDALGGALQALLLPQHGRVVVLRVVPAKCRFVRTTALQNMQEFKSNCLTKMRSGSEAGLPYHGRVVVPRVVPAIQ